MQSIYSTITLTKTGDRDGSRVSVHINTPSLCYKAAFVNSLWVSGLIPYESFSLHLFPCLFSQSLMLSTDLSLLCNFLAVFSLSWHLWPVDKSARWSMVPPPRMSSSPWGKSCPPLPFYLKFRCVGCQELLSSGSGWHLIQFHRREERWTGNTFPCHLHPAKCDGPMVL